MFSLNFLLLVGCHRLDRSLRGGGLMIWDSDDGFNIHSLLERGDGLLPLVATVRGCRRGRRYSHGNVIEVAPTAPLVQSHSLRAPVSSLHSSESVPQVAG